MVDVADAQAAIAEIGKQTHDGSPDIRTPVSALGDALVGSLEAPELPAFANAARPDHTGSAQAFIIFNSTSSKLNIWDGAQWVEADGTPT